MNERIKIIRTTLGLSMDKFGESIGIKKSSVSLLESGKNNPSDQTVKLICTEFNVNENWLRTGDGEMFFKPKTKDLVSKAAKLLGEKDPTFEAFVETYSKLNPSNRKVILDFGLDFLKSLQGKVDNVD